ncbi:unnamed protein product (macronuclear) [Paramecium tetraurelia]|uniref:Uncharacterized protein n=1 Tax=Paramecium tetraurelia TaxID=5888 RepID=A0CWP5_PARTE|nr:uncharacterized protein GSPATT00001415001 [Paramecium tetraurelia]CAK75212.1 unnamed protein product [Paramecium tetraurelia]|eukprot:XP_001442609.1 hypothetical protein (macronuclear) [Paramecium tetraurelia strain d4-2]
MKASLVCILILTVAATDFESFQQALEFDPQTLSGDHCGNDDQFTQQYEAFLPWIQLLEEGEIEMQEDHSVLTQARDKIKLVREYIQDLDEELEKDQTNNNNNVVEQPTQQPTQQSTQQPTGQSEPQPVQPAQEVQEDDEEEENDDPFGWGAGEIPQHLLVDSKKKHNKNLKGHAKVLLEVMNQSKSLKYKSKIKRIVAMATSLDTDMGTQDLQERKNRKLELCDLILDELINMIEFLEKVMNDYQYQQEAYDIFKKKQEEIVEVANGCGARVISLQDTYSTSFVQTQPLKRNKKQNKEQKRKRKH